MIKPIAKLIIALNGNVKRSQIAAGFAWGLLLGLVPVNSLIWFVLFIVSFFFKHNHASKLLVLAIVKLLGSLLGPALDWLGWEILHIEALAPMFTVWYNLPLVPFTRFYNTLVAGGLCAGVLLWVPVYFLVRALVPVYRNHLVPKIKSTKFFKALAKFPLISKIGNAVSSMADLRNTAK
ncbi:TIGR03546 family protein [Treponema sp. OttesenSCG-928-L16]|nr:TIGR03546 family protein [Treponema sp. OttesenSCG-928-L16]